MKKLSLLILMSMMASMTSAPLLSAQEEDSALNQAKKLALALAGQETPYLRVVKGKTTSRLETACVTFENLDTGASVTLVSAVHIGDKAYYKVLQKHLEDYDKVFFEGVKQDGPSNELMSLVSRLQSSLKNFLGLAFQPEQMDMSKPNMVHADMKASQLQELLKKRGISLLPNEDLLGMFGPMVVKGLEMIAPAPDQKPNRLQDLMQRRMKSVFAEALSKGIQIYDKLKKPEDKARDELLIGARNQIAMDLLKKSLAAKPGGKYAILYGGAHHPDFEKRLTTELEMQKTGTQWLSAWDISPSKPQPASKPAAKKAPKKKRVL
ncbi:MAG: hypothetical protein ACI97A_001500 [Planctomycetota bacterium]|jgi:hypothetical protein